METKTIRDLLDPIFDQREEIIRAFMAKEGLYPDEVEQVVGFTNKGIKWFVRKRVV